MRKIFVFAAVLLLVSCNPSDRQLQREVKSSLDLIDTAINVNVTKGVVTLEGQVLDESAKNAAESSIREVKGVKSVVNRLTTASEVSQP